MKRWLVPLSCVALLVGMAVGVFPAWGTPQDTPSQGVTSTPVALADLENQAYKAVCTGDFDKGNELLQKAAIDSKDPTAQLMANWLAMFETERQTFAGQRHDEFEKAVADVKKLLAVKMDSYALDEANSAYTLADDKDEFRHQKWVDDLINTSIAEAAGDEQSGRWLRAYRIYSDLETLDPADADWKDKLSLVNRRVRLLMYYAPDQLKKVQDVEAIDRKAAEAILAPATQPSTQASTPSGGANSSTIALNPATQPATQPATKPSDDLDFSIDWHQVTRGANREMLFTALQLAAPEYYRDLNFADLLNGGIMGMRALATTQGLADTFPGLKDEQKRTDFLAALDAASATAKTAGGLTGDDQENAVDEAINKLLDANEQTVQFPEQVFATEFADGAFSKCDPFSTIIWPYELQEFRKATSGSFGGVGVQIESDPDGDLKVITPLANTPAYKAGIKAGDVIVRINGKDAHGIPIERAVDVITGKPGTQVTLSIRNKKSEVTDRVLTRENIMVESVKGYVLEPGGTWNYYVDPDQKIAYIRITNFSETTADDLGEVINQLNADGAKAIILDLRYNPGGLLSAAKEVVNKFVSSGVIVSTHPNRPTVNPPSILSADPYSLQTKIPLVVMINQYSASASEIVSGALQDDKRAILVGERSFGKGSVQNLMPLDGESLNKTNVVLKLTTAHYYLPSGRCIHREENSTTWGVDPDVTIPMTPDQMRAENDARQDMDVLHDIGEPAPTTGPSTQPSELIQVDPQLAAALLVLRLQLNGPAN